MRSMTLILRKAAHIPVLLIVISIVTFALLHLAPGGPVGLISGNPKVSGDDMQRIRENYGLDRPLPLQNLCWFRQAFLRFDFGRSYVTGRPVSSMIMERLPATIELMSVAMILALVTGTLLGIAAAMRRNGPADQAFSLISVAGISMPVFWLGLIAIYLFSLKLGIFPAGGRESIGSGGSFIDRLRHLVLPASVLSISYLAIWGRFLRSSLIEVFGSDFIRTARAKGLGESKIIMKHAMRNAVLPALTVMLMQMPTLFTGAVITETVFSWPGMGRLFYDGLTRQDYTRVLGIIVISSVLIMVFNLTADIISALIDPRIDLAETGTAGKGAVRAPAGEAQVQR